MTKQRILDVATEEFSKHGFSAVSMNSLVKLLDINKATIYYHYKDKQTLYQEVLKASLSDTKETREKFLTGITDPKEKFTLFIKSFLVSISQKPYLVGLWLHEVAKFGSNIDENLVPLVDEMIISLNEILNELSLKDKYKDCNPYFIFSMIHGTIDSFYATQMSPLAIDTKSELKLDANKTLDFLEDMLAQIILNAICKEEKSNV